MAVPELRLRRPAPLRLAEPVPIPRPVPASGPGTTGAVIFFCLSLTPSLLPRNAAIQGAIGGILAITGYFVGITIAWVGRRLTHRRPAESARRSGWRLLAIGSAVFIPLSLAQGMKWQTQIARLMDMPEPPKLGVVIILPLSLAMTVVVVGTARVVNKTARGLGRILARWVPVDIARIISALLVAALTLALLQGLVAEGAMRAMNNSFKALNGETNPGSKPPASPMLSGSPASLVSWASLGRRGRDFVSQAATREDLRAFNGRDPVEPIRVYVGLDAASSADARAQLAVRELERTGAFARSALVVLTTTGTGWVDRDSIDPLEYMFNGDSALVSIQYSYIPSWISFMVDRERARNAGQALFDAVYERWSVLPRADRPKLLVFGESLGVLGAESAFGGLNDLRNRTDGALFIGPPNNSAIRRELTAKRDDGSTEALPVYERGTAVRFAQSPSDLRQPPNAWEAPRLAYLQHASDPVVWWSPDLMLDRPDWLREPPGPDVLPAMRWYPFVTFWQMSADLVFSTQAEPGHGHEYGAEAVWAWASIAEPPGWTDEGSRRLERMLDRGSR